MPKKIETVDVFVRVDVGSGWTKPTIANKVLRAEEMVKSINRHCDEVERAYVEYERESVCSYCGHKWTEDSAEFNGGCCDKDLEHDPDAEAPSEENAEVAAAFDAQFNVGELDNLIAGVKTAA